MSAADGKSKPDLRLVDNDAPPTEEILDPISNAREQLRSVAQAQQELLSLSEQVARLEVECIDVDIAIGATTAALSLSPQDAAKLGAVLARQETLEAELAQLVAKPGVERTDDEALPKLELGIEALKMWLEAPQVKDSKRAATLARIVLLMGIFIVGWAAYVFHPALMVLIIPVAGPISMILRRGENTQWRRMGAKQKFQQSGHAEPKTWEEGLVQERLAALQKEHDQRSNRGLKVADLQPDDTALDERFTALNYEQVDIDMALEQIHTSTGVDIEALDETQRKALDKAAEAKRLRQRLEQTRQQRDTLRAESEQRKDDIYRLLSSNGVAPSGGRADLEALSAGLNELQARS